MSTFYIVSNLVVLMNLGMHIFCEKDHRTLNCYYIVNLDWISFIINYPLIIAI
jgi:hypothetical protein